MKTNVYIFNEKSPAGNYGIGTYIVQLIDCLKGVKNINIHIVNLRSDVDEFYFETSENISYYHVPNHLSESSIDKYYQMIFYLLNQFIRKEDCNIFHFNFFSHIPIIDLLKRKGVAHRIIFTVHYFDWTLGVRGSISHFKRIVNNEKRESLDIKERKLFNIYHRDKDLLAKVDLIVCVSKYSFSLLPNLYHIPEEKIILLPNSVQDNESARTLEKEEKIKLRRSLFFNNNEKIFLYVGRLDKDKGGVELLKAFKKLLAKKKTCRLVIVGGGNHLLYFKECKDIWGKITFTGYLSQVDVQRFYQIADIGVLPSFSEQCSFVAIEMMKYSLPVIGTTSTGLNEMITDNYNGYKVKIEENEDRVYLDYKKLSDIMLFLINNKSNMNLVAKQSRKFYEINYRLDVVRKQNLISIYSNILYSNGKSISD